MENQKPLRIELPPEPDEKRELLDRFKANNNLAKYVLAQYGPEGRTPIPTEAWETLSKIVNDPALRKKGVSLEKKDRSVEN